MSHMQNILIFIDLLVKILKIHNFVDCDFCLRFLIVEVFTETIIAIVVVVERENVSDGDGLIEICFCEGEHDVLGDFGAGTNDE